MTTQEQTWSAGGAGEASASHNSAWENALVAWETVLALSPGHPKALAERLECILHLKRWDDALRACEAAETELGIEDRIRVARKLTAGEEFEKALRVWQQIVGQAAFYEDALTAIRGQLWCFAKLGLTNQRPSVDGGALPRSSSDHAARHHEPRTTNCNPRHVAILGVSYCGSTLLSLVLGALPGVANIGETHWLVEPRSSRKTRESQNLTSDGFEQCVFCGSDCAIIGDDLRHRLARQPGAFYAILGEVLDTDILVSADKNYWHVVRRDPELHNDAIVLFRDPFLNWRSYAHRTGKSDADARQSYFERWAVDYSNFLDNYPNTGRKIVLDLDHFLARPELALYELCQALELPYVAASLEYWWRPQHCVGGNLDVRRRLLSGDVRNLRIAASPNEPSSNLSDGAVPDQVVAVTARLREASIRVAD